MLKTKIVSFIHKELPIANYNDRNGLSMLFNNLVEWCVWKYTTQYVKRILVLVLKTDR